MDLDWKEVTHGPAITWRIGFMVTPGSVSFECEGGNLEGLSVIGVWDNLNLLAEAKAIPLSKDCSQPFSASKERALSVTIQNMAPGTVKRVRPVILYSPAATSSVLNQEKRRHLASFDVEESP